MTQIQKLVSKFKANPGSIKFGQLSQVLQHYEFILIPAKGSHVKFKHPKSTADLIVPVHNGDCKDIYKKEALKRIKELE